jgi:hypothetical protein
MRHILFSVLSQRSNIVNKDFRFYIPNITDVKICVQNIYVHT